MLKILKSGKPLIIVMCSIIVVLSALVFIGRGVGGWLAVSDPYPPKLDMLFTFGGETDRYSFSRTLFRKYPDCFWMISLGPFPVFDTLKFTTLVKRSIAYEGFDTSHVIVNDTCTSTGSEINILDYAIGLALHEYKISLPENASSYDSLWYQQHTLAEKWFESRKDSVLEVGLVSHPFHMRRITLLANRIDRKGRVRFHALPVPYFGDMNTFLKKRKWWRYEKDVSFVVSELVKIVYYFTIRDHVDIPSR